MPSLTVIRHSLTLANEQGLLMGSKLDSPLSNKGIDLARAKGYALKASGFNPENVYISELLRTQQTANIILEVLGLDIEPIVLKALNERDFGIYDGKQLQELLDGFEKYGPNPPTVETVEHFVSRIVQSLERINKESNTSSLIVAHNNPVNVMKAAIFEPSKLQTFWETDNPDYCEGFTYTF